MKFGLVVSACVLIGALAPAVHAAPQAARQYKPIYVPDDDEPAPAPARTPPRAPAQVYAPAPLAGGPVAPLYAPEPPAPPAPPAPADVQPKAAPAAYAPAPLAGGPAAPPPPPPVISRANVIQGAASLRTRDGRTRNCAAVRLFPRGPSTIAFVRQAYGAESGGFARRTTWEPQSFDPVVSVQACDAGGGFVFDRLPDGDYYLAAVVSIESPASDGAYLIQEGGTIVSLVSVAGGEVKSVVLTR